MILGIKHGASNEKNEKIIHFGKLEWKLETFMNVGFIPLNVICFITLKKSFDFGWRVI